MVATLSDDSESGGGATGVVGEGASVGLYVVFVMFCVCLVGGGGGFCTSVCTTRLL